MLKNAKAFVPVAVVICVLGFQVQQVIAACQCMCSAVSGFPSSVATDTGGGCQSTYSYTYKVHFATNDDSCGTGISSNGYSYNDGFAPGVISTSISPSTFTISGDGETQEFTCSGTLKNAEVDGTSKTQVIGGSCNTGVLSITVTHDPDC